MKTPPNGCYLAGDRLSGRWAGGGVVSEKLEVSARAVSVLATFFRSRRSQLEFAAENILEEIAAGRVTSAAARAETAWQVIVAAGRSERWPSYGSWVLP